MTLLRGFYPVLCVRSLLFYVLAGVLVLPFLLLWPAMLWSRDVVYAITDCYLRVLRWLLRWVCGVSYEVHGRHNLPDGAVLIAAQHESAWETLFFQLIFPHPLMYAKKPLFAYPIIGPVMRKFGHIPVDPDGGETALRAGLRAGVQALEAGRSVVIFPSGTRQAKETQELKAGVGVLYQLARVPVVPVRLNSGACWPYGSFLKHPGTIRVEIGTPIPAALNRRDFMTTLNSGLIDT